MTFKGGFQGMTRSRVGIWGRRNHNKSSSHLPLVYFRVSALLHGRRVTSADSQSSQGRTTGRAAHIVEKQEEGWREVRQAREELEEREKRLTEITAEVDDEARRRMEELARLEESLVEREEALNAREGRAEAREERLRRREEEKRRGWEGEQSELEGEVESLAGMLEEARRELKDAKKEAAMGKDGMERRMRELREELGREAEGEREERRRVEEAGRDRLEAARLALKQAGNDCSLVRLSLSESEAARQRMEEEALCCREKEGRARGDAERARREVDTAKAGLARAEARAARLEAQLEVAAREGDALKRAVEEARGMDSEARREVWGLRGEKGELERRAAAAEAELVAARRERDVLGDAIVQAEAGLKERDERLRTAALRAGEAAVERDVLERENQTVRGEVGALREEVGGLRAAKEEAWKREEEVRGSVGDLVEEWERVRGRGGEVERREAELGEREADLVERQGIVAERDVPPLAKPKLLYRAQTWGGLQATVDREMVLWMSGSHKQISLGPTQTQRSLLVVGSKRVPTSPRLISMFVRSCDV